MPELMLKLAIGPEDTDTHTQAKEPGCPDPFVSWRGAVTLRR